MTRSVALDTRPATGSCCGVAGASAAGSAGMTAAPVLVAAGRAAAAAVCPSAYSGAVRLALAGWISCWPASSSRRQSWSSDVYRDCSAKLAA